MVIGQPSAKSEAVSCSAKCEAIASIHCATVGECALASLMSRGTSSADSWTAATAISSFPPGNRKYTDPRGAPLNSMICARPDLPGHYAATKAMAEQLVVAANGRGIDTVVVRPRFVWGAGDTTLLPELVKTVRTGAFAWVGGGRHRTDTTHVDNVVHGLLLAAERGRPGEAYFVTDGEPVEFRGFVSALLETQGVAAPTRVIPLGVAVFAARACEALWRWLPLRGKPPLDRMTVWLSGQECTLDIGKARRELGYQPIRTRADGLAGLRGDGQVAS